MSTRQKDFKKALRKANSEKDVDLRFRKMGEIGSEYLKSIYSDSAIKLIERTILNKYDENTEIPEGVNYVFLEAAKYYSRKGEFDKAEELLSRIADSRNVTICLQARYQADLIKIKRRLEQGTIDTETIEDIKNVVKDDEEHELETLHAGEFSDYDLFRSYFGEKIPVKDLTEEIFPPSMRKPTGTKITPNPDNPIHPLNNGYNEELSANNRLKFLVENFPIVSGSTGYGNFKGAILFEIEGSDLVIVENFWKQTRDGEVVEDYGKALYILPKDQAMDLIKLSRGEIIAKGDPRIATVRHSSKEFYNNLVTRFNAIENPELQGIEQITNPLENTDTKERKEDRKEKQSIKNFTDENQEFLAEINANIGGIIAPEIMEGLLKRASYSFKDLYEERLKEEILERLEILEIPEDNRELEAQKVFLYLRMAKNISMINSRAINGENLSNVLDDSIIEYEKGFSFFEKHVGDGLTYNNLRNSMKEYVTTGIDPLEQTQESKNILSNDSEILHSETDTILPEQNEELDTLVDNDTDRETKTEILDFATKYMKLLEELERVNAESERLDKKLEEKKQEHLEKQQATIRAKEAEEKARLATIEATEQEELSSIELNEMRAEREKLEEEKKKLQEKKQNIDDMLR